MSDPLRARLSPARRTISHGPWSLELATDEFVELRWRGRVILRGIRAAIRDQDWRTLEPVVTAVRDDESGSDRVILLHIEYSGWGQTYAAVVALGLTDDAAVVEFDGRADAPFRGNRIGLVVLHEPSNAGEAVAITSPDGTTTTSEFPVEIQPHQPFMNIAGMRWRHDGVAVDVRFTGDTFETEDQRNWTDASYKTYSTPLGMPYPVEHPPGSTVRQSVTVTVQPDAGFAEEVTHRSGEAHIVIDDVAVGRVPAIGLSAGTDPATAAREIVAIDGLDALLVELAGPVETRREHLRSARHEAARLHVPLDLRIVAKDSTELAATLDLADLSEVTRLGVFHPRSHVTEPELWAALKAESAQCAFAGTLVAGARSHFTELNRTIDRLPLDADAVAFSMTPQMHAGEVERIVQTLPMQRLVAQNALRLSDGRPLHLGPITLKPRFNAVATRGGYDEAARLGMITDDLQSTSFTVAWTLGSVAALSAVGTAVGASGVTAAAVASVSYFETAGARGIDAADGEPYPVGRLIRALASLRGKEVLRADGIASEAGADSTLIVYPVRDDSRVVVFVANLRSVARAVDIHVGTSSIRCELEPWETQTLEFAATSVAAPQPTTQRKGTDS